MLALPAPPSGRTLAAFAGALAFGTVGGWIFAQFGVPLAWMLGSMVACTIAVMAGAPVATPKAVRPPVVALIGAALGTAFTGDVLSNLLAWTIPLAGLVVYLIVVGLGSYAYYRLVVRLDRPTAFFAGMPGGIVEMSMLGGERGGSESMIALAHSARIFLVVALVPFGVELLSGTVIPPGVAGRTPFGDVGRADVAWFLLATVGGVVFARLLRLPAPYLLGPMLASAGLHVTGVTDFEIPTLAVNAAQVAMGATIGCRFRGTSLRRLATVMGHSAVVIVGAIAVTMLFALALAPLAGVRPEALVLAYAPAGLAEMSLAALALGIEVPLVVAHHVIRLALVVAAADLVFRRTP
jgi:membrane AbrB-like protein